VDVSGYRNKNFYPLQEFGRFRPKQEGFVPFGGFWTSQAKVVRICPFWSSLDGSSQKNEDFSRLGEFERLRPKGYGFVPFG
jgi:hypothetical protein